jgi:hypothetical protein
LDNNTITALATVILALVGVSQIKMLILQNRQKKIEFVDEYRKQWINSKKDFGIIIYIGRNENEYYQVVDKNILEEYSQLVKNTNSYSPTVWALDSTRNIFTILSDISIKILKDQLDISDIYPLFGTQLLRHSKPLRILLDKRYIDISSKYNNKAHNQIRNEIQNWLTYHDGIRRRVLILIDLLWAEATRLEDLPPQDIKSAADAKINTGYLNRERLYKECLRLNGFSKIIYAKRLSTFLKHSEYKTKCSNIGINKEKLKELDKKWTEYLLM